MSFTSPTSRRGRGGSGAGRSQHWRGGLRVVAALVLAVGAAACSDDGDSLAIEDTADEDDSTTDDPDTTAGPDTSDDDPDTTDEPGTTDEDDTTTDEPGTSDEDDTTDDDPDTTAGPDTTDEDDPETTDEDDTTEDSEVTEPPETTQSATTTTRPPSTTTRPPPTTTRPPPTTTRPPTTTTEPARARQRLRLTTPHQTGIASERIEVSSEVTIASNQSSIGWNPDFEAVDTGNHVRISSIGPETVCAVSTYDAGVIQFSKNREGDTCTLRVAADGDAAHRPLDLVITVDFVGQGCVCWTLGGTPRNAEVRPGLSYEVEVLPTPDGVQAIGDKIAVRDLRFARPDGTTGGFGALSRGPFEPNRIRFTVAIACTAPVGGVVTFQVAEQYGGTSVWRYQQPDDFRWTVAGPPAGGCSTQTPTVHP